MTEISLSTMTHKDNRFPNHQVTLNLADG